MNVLRVGDSEFIRRLEDVIVLAGTAADAALAAAADVDEVTRVARREVMVVSTRVAELAPQFASSIDE